MSLTAPKYCDFDFAHPFGCGCTEKSFISSQSIFHRQLVEEDFIEMMQATKIYQVPLLTEEIVIEQINLDAGDITTEENVQKE